MNVDVKVLQRILIAVLALLTVVLGAERLLPAAWQVERETVIAAPPPLVYARILALRKWNEWSLAHSPPPDSQVEYSGPEAGPGTTRRWIHEDGRGVMKIMDAQRDRRVEYEVLMDGGTRAITGSFHLLPGDTGTRVVWRAGLASGAWPLERYAALLERHVLGQEMETSLARLKARMEPAR